MEPVRGYALLSVGSGSLPTGDLNRFGKLDYFGQQRYHFMNKILY
jgi:hypothetical protein